MKKIIVTVLTAIIAIVIARFSGMKVYAHGYAGEWFKSDYDIYIGEVTAVGNIEVTSRNRNVEVLPTAVIKGDVKKGETVSFDLLLTASCGMLCKGEKYLFVTSPEFKQAYNITNCDMPVEYGSYDYPFETFVVVTGCWLLYTVSGRITFCLIIAVITFIVVKKRRIKKSAQK